MKAVKFALDSTDRSPNSTCVVLPRLRLRLRLCLVLLERIQASLQEPWLSNNLVHLLLICQSILNVNMHYTSICVCVGMWLRVCTHKMPQLAP